MPRNLDGRIEALAPVEPPELQQRLQEILDVDLADDTLAWRLGPDGAWQHVERRNTVDTHRRLQELALARATRRPVVAALDSWAIGSAGG